MNISNVLGKLAIKATGESACESTTMKGFSLKIGFKTDKEDAEGKGITEGAKPTGYLKKLISSMEIDLSIEEIIVTNPTDKMTVDMSGDVDESKENDLPVTEKVTDGKKSKHINKDV